MNAQEAIERMESKLNQLNDIRLTLESEGKTEEKEYFNLCENIKAFSIVLESDKLLHSISDVTPVYGGELKLHRFEMEDYYLDEKTAKSIGITYEALVDEGADE